MLQGLACVVFSANFVAKKTSIFLTHVYNAI